jgi:hypothetical protein
MTEGSEQRLKASGVGEKPVGVRRFGKSARMGLLLPSTAAAGLVFLSWMRSSDISPVLPIKKHQPIVSLPILTQAPLSVVSPQNKGEARGDRRESSSVDVSIPPHDAGLAHLPSGHVGPTPEALEVLGRASAEGGNIPAHQWVNEFHRVPGRQFSAEDFARLTQSRYPARSE